MAIKVSQAFQRTSANPVDESMALTKAQMLTVNDNLMPAYYFTICQDDGKIYLYDKSATPSVTTGKFTVFEGGGGGGGGTGVIIDATLTAAGWNSNTNQQTVTFTGYESSMGGVIGMPTSATAAQKEAYAEAKINVVSQSGAAFTFECEEIPSIDLPVTLYAGGSGSGGGSVPAGGTTGQVLTKKSNTDEDVEWKDTSNSIFEIHFANDAVDVTYSQLGEAFSANKILKLIDTANNIVLAFTGYNSGTYYFSTICLNIRQEMINTSIVLYQSTPSSDVVATQVQRLTLTEDVQKTVMPTAAATYVGKAYQYIGTTDANYTNGLFYTCVDNSGTYEWVQLDVQTAPGLNSDSIQDIIGSASLSNYAVTYGNTYSTTEQIVGRWIDGKPIYQKTITGTSPANNTATVIGSVASLVAANAKIKNMFGYIEWDSGTDSGVVMIPNYSFRDQQNSVNIWVGANSASLYMECMGSLNFSRPFTLTIQYTKTTD